MINLCSTLQAIEIGGGLCEVCKSSSSKYLSNFSSLQYCTLLHHGTCHSRCFQYISASCKKLKCITVKPNRNYQQFPYHPTGILLLSTCSNLLEQVCIVSNRSTVSDNFMESFSAHEYFTSTTNLKEFKQ